MSKAPDSDAFFLEQIIGSGRIGYSISEIARKLGLSNRQCQEYTEITQKLVKLAIRKNSIIGSYGSKTLDQITTQRNSKVSCTVRKWTVQLSLRSKFLGSRIPSIVPLLNARN